MKTIQASCVVVALSVMSLSLLGCAPSDQPELGQVTGTITLDGKPLSGVSVVFQPDGGRPAHGTTNAEGKYELTYIRTTLGTKVGHNRVEIAPSEEDGDATELEGDAEIPNAKPPTQSGRPAVPARYNTSSELEADVKPGENTFDFALTS